MSCRPIKDRTGLENAIVTAVIERRGTRHRVDAVSGNTMATVHHRVIDAELVEYCVDNFRSVLLCIEGPASPTCISGSDAVETGQLIIV